ncbi:MAG: shikimate kinase [Lysobacterales bacterium]|nr:shikimate kinase [Xanthomonadales bacterium]MCB1613089.1 shikimate kinase [Xanthomonadales bacterium]MCP5475171.1 shikimate kinase [Rhodanobacteraceae bacterium]
MSTRRNLFLIGPMGAGKSTVGRRLARHLDMRFVDLDQMIESETGSSIALLFDVEGEGAFRQREAATLARATELDGIVLATGGGSVLDPGSRQLLRERGLVIYLEAPVDLQLERLARDRTRPLLRAPDRTQRLINLASARNPIYQDLADLTITADRSGPGSTARRTLAALHQHLKDKDTNREPAG